MASPTGSPPTDPSPDTVGNAFIKQYYYIFHNSPGEAFRFYEDSSVLSRQDANGDMKTVTTMQGINEFILSLDSANLKVELKSVDAQNSYNKGVIVLVTGWLTGKDNLKRKFVQSFFLAPQPNGYFVLNDVFRYVEYDDTFEKNNTDDDDGPNEVSSVPEPVVTPALEDPVPDKDVSVEKEKAIVEKTGDFSRRDIKISDVKESRMEPKRHLKENNVSADSELASTSAPKDAPKKSYASIVKVAKGTPGPTKIYVPAKTSPKKIEDQPAGSKEPPPVAKPSAQECADGPDSSETREEGEGHSIYIRNVPFDTLPSQLEEEFKKFGPIKKGGVQIRSDKAQSYCFGFVEFLSLDSMNSAIQASPLTVLGRQVVIEAKRSPTRVDGDRSGVAARRGGYRTESFRVRGSYGSSRGRGYGGGSRGRGYGRTAYVNRSEMPVRGRGPPISSANYRQV